MTPLLLIALLLAFAGGSRAESAPVSFKPLEPEPPPAPPPAPPAPPEPPPEPRPPAPPPAPPPEPPPKPTNGGEVVRQGRLDTGQNFRIVRLASGQYQGEIEV